jgi:SAM-dependent methyltransferase
VVQDELARLGQLAAVLPRPLSSVIARVAADEVGEIPVLLVHHVIDAAQMCCQYLVAVAVGMQNERATGGASAASSERLVLGSVTAVGPPDAPTFSDWVQALSSVSKQRILERMPGLDEAASAWVGLVRFNVPRSGRGQRSRPLTGVMAELVHSDQPAWWVQIRNVLAHTTGLTQARAQELGAALLPAFAQAVATLAEGLMRCQTASWKQPGIELVPPGVERWQVTWLPATDPRVEAVNRSRRQLNRQTEPATYLLIPLALDWHAVELWPLLTVGTTTPTHAEVEDLRNESASNVFWRVQKEVVYYDALGDNAVIRRGGASELRAYRERFRAAPAVAGDFEQDFWAEIEEESRGFAGRAAEVEQVTATLRRAMAAGRARIYYLTGEAGRGKSALIGQVALSLREAAGGWDKGSQIVVHRFKAADIRNSLRAFVVLALKALTGEEPSEGIDEEQAAIQRLRAEIARQNVVVVADGLDELSAVDARAVAILIEMAAAAGLWLFSSRPDAPDKSPVVKPMIEAGAERIAFPGSSDGQLPLLSQEDIRAIIMKHGMSLVRDELLRLDEDRASLPGIANRLVDNLEHRDGNQPQYLLVWLQYLAGLESRERLWQELDGAASTRSSTLPKGIERLYEKLLFEFGTGDLQSFKAPALCMLAQAREPLAPEMLSEIYRAGTGYTDEEIGQRGQKFERLMSLFGPTLLEPRDDSDGVSGFRIESEGFVDHLSRSQTVSDSWRSARQDLATASLQPMRYPKAQKHLHRHGIAYLMAAGRVDEALSLLREKYYSRWITRDYRRRARSLLLEMGAESSYGSLYLESFPDYISARDRHDLFVADLLARLTDHNLCPPPGSQILVLGSGNGIHDPAFAAHRYRIVNFDIQPEIADLGRLEAKKLPEADIVYHVGDMTKDLPFERESMDAVFNIGSSFGFEDRDEDNAAIFRHAATVLKPSKPFIFEYTNGLYFRQLKQESPVTRTALRDGSIRTEYRFEDADAGTTLTAISLRRANGEFAGIFHHFLHNYSCSTIQAMMTAVGLDIVALYGGRDGRVNGDPFNEKLSSGMVIIARKRRTEPLP